jgi:hypothetical protein
MPDTANKQILQLWIQDAKNPSLAIVGLQVRIDGEAVDANQLDVEGKVLKAGALALNNQTCQLSCKNPGLKNAEFTVWASAPGYVSNFKHVRVNARDSLLYVDIPLVKLADAPEDVRWQNSLIAYANTSTNVPGGLQSVRTNQGEKTFLFAAAMQSTSFNTPLALDLILGDDTHNPETGLAIETGDFIELWFLAENTGVWEKLKNQTIRTDNSGRKYVSTSLEKAGTILAGYGLDPCLEPLSITLEKTENQDQTLCVRLLQGNKQILAARRIAPKSRGPYILYLPKNVDYTLSMHAGANTMSNKVYQNDLPNCAALALIKNNQ